MATNFGHNKSLCETLETASNLPVSVDIDSHLFVFLPGFGRHFALMPVGNFSLRPLRNASPNSAKTLIFFQ
jgi:hypothetical protein